MKVAIIPARGGSKRIPRKNVREFAGKPMIAHAIELAFRSAMFERVIVSTDNDEIARVAEQYGAEAPFRRPEQLADDHATTAEVMAHAVAYLENHGTMPSAVCCIYPTAPFINFEDLKTGLRLLEDGKWQYVFAATQYAYPVFRSFKKNTQGELEMLFPEHYMTRSQDLPEIFHDAGQFYWGRPTAWLAKTRIFGPDSTVVLIPPSRVQDIDTPDDWARAEQIMFLLAKMENHA